MSPHPFLFSPKLGHRWAPKRDQGAPISRELFHPPAKAILHGDAAVLRNGGESGSGTVEWNQSSLPPRGGAPGPEHRFRGHSRCLQVASSSRKCAIFLTQVDWKETPLCWVSILRVAVPPSPPPPLNSHTHTIPREESNGSPREAQPSQSLVSLWLRLLGFGRASRGAAPAMSPGSRSPLLTLSLLKPPGEVLYAHILELQQVL